MSVVDGTIQATIDSLQRIVADAEAKSADLREEMTALRQQIINAEGPEAEKARQNLRRLGVPAFSDWQRPLPRAPESPRDAPTAPKATSAPPKPAPASPAPSKPRK